MERRAGILKSDRNWERPGYRQLSLTNSVASDTGSTLLGNIASNVLAGAAGALVGGSSGAFAASNADLYNRQLNHTEKQAIADKADGDAAEQAKLTQAACYAVQCWAQYSPNSDEYAENYVSAQQTARLAPELQWVQSLSASNGLFHYTLTDQVIDGASSQLDSAKRGAENLGDQFAAAVRQTAGRSSSSDNDPLTSAMDGGEPPSGTAGAVVTLPMVTCALAVDSVAGDGGAYSR